MDLLNSTPFSPFVFESLDPDSRPIHCVVCRATYSIKDWNKVELSAVQQPIMVADRYRALPWESSLEIESDLSPFKEATDVTLNAIAKSPSGYAQTSWNVRLAVGEIDKTLRVCGPRKWNKRMGVWTLSEPIPTLEVPLCYELAFGGRDEQEGWSYEYNPVGIGHSKLANGKDLKEMPAPQIESPTDPIDRFDKEYAPQGFGPIAKHWLPRRLLCGNADDNWKATRWPLRPQDFEFRYYNAAPTDQTVPGYLKGGELVQVFGIDPQCHFEFHLPNDPVTVLCIEETFTFRLLPMVLDTLHIDLISRQVALTWRLTLLKSAPIKFIQFAVGRLKPVSVF